MKEKFENLPGDSNELSKVDLIKIKQDQHKSTVYQSLIKKLDDLGIDYKEAQPTEEELNKIKERARLWKIKFSK